MYNPWTGIRNLPFHMVGGVKNSLHLDGVVGLVGCICESCFGIELNSCFVPFGL